MTTGAAGLAMIESYIEALPLADKALVAIHVMELRELIASAPSAHLIYVALAFVSAQRLAVLDKEAGTE